MICALALSVMIFAPMAIGTERASAETADCKAAYLCDFESGTAVREVNPTDRLPVASMCKIMTLLLCFEAVDRGDLEYSEQIPVSERAAGMGGSQVFLESGNSYAAEELMKSIAVCSANDSCVAVAERIAGSEEGFVERMNVRARELGTENTLFANCTGLPKEPQYSCAKDVSIMLRALLSHEKYFEFAGIRLENFKHPDGRETSMTNTNKLIRNYAGCDGGKTGFTNQAGFCLAATAKRGQTRLVSVVIGAESSQDRFDSVSEMFDYAFANYESRLIASAEDRVAQIDVRGSRQKNVGLHPEHDLTAFCKKGEDNITVEYFHENALRAPLARGIEAGEAVLYRDGVELSRCKLLTAEEAPRFSWSEGYSEGASHWNL